MEARVISHLPPLSFYQHLDLGFITGRDLREILLRPSVFGLVRCDYHCLKCMLMPRQVDP